jgi:alanine-glyoxylate transaminase / serine-glyoxylate transaminase / serine-pyruvate transaminase
MAGRQFIFIPGPTNVPDRVLSAMHRPMEDHRSSAFPTLLPPIIEGLKEVFGTRRARPFVFSATGTGMWEAALVNTLSPGDKVLACRYGQFSHLFTECARRLGLDVTIIDVPWGEGAPPEQIEAALRADSAHQFRGVIIAHNETATGVTSDIAAVRAAMDSAKHPALLYVDGVSSVGSIEFRMDDWGVDLAISSSQKGFMMPSGLGIICASDKALAAGEKAKLPRYFFDFRDMAKANDTGYFPYTAPTTLLYGLQEALNMLAEEGLPAVHARHRRLAEGVRRAVHAWGRRLLATDPKWYSDTISAIVVPPDADARKVIDIAFNRYGLALGGGLGETAGKVFRIGHLGDLNELMLLGALGGVEMAMADAGIAVTPGSGVAAASEWWRSSRA